MSAKKNRSIVVQGHVVAIMAGLEEDDISLTDIARSRNAERTDDLIRNWLRNRNTVEFPGVWERLNNPGFNPVEADGVRRQKKLSEGQKR